MRTCVRVVQVIHNEDDVQFVSVALVDLLFDVVNVIVFIEKAKKHVNPCIRDSLRVVEVVGTTPDQEFSGD